MNRVVVLLGKSTENWNSPFLEAETFRDPEILLEHIRTEPGTIRWVAIAPGYSHPSADPSGIAQQIRDADPTLSVVLLGTDSVAAEVWHAALAEDDHGATVIPAAGAGLTEPGEAERLLEEMRRRALEAEKLASVTTLTAGIFHDIGTPMTAILCYAELIAKSVGDEKNRKRATTIVEQVNRVSELIEALMNLSQTGEHPHLPMELSHVLDKTLDFYREKFKRHAVDTELHYDRAAQILGNPDSLQRVFMSLFLNALDAMPQGGTLRVSLAETDRSEVEVRVSDTGKEFDPDLRARIFEPNFSTEQRTNETDLGLLVAKTIVEEHGGTIALSSEPDRGTEFHLLFPALSEGGP